MRWSLCSGVVVLYVATATACSGDKSSDPRHSGSGGRGAGGSDAAVTSTTGATSTSSGPSDLPPEWTSCTAGGQCALRHEDCCPPCGPHELSEVIALQADHVDDLQAALCGTPPGEPPSCADLSCVASTDYVVALCRQQTCVAVDIRDDELTACSVNDDCRLRWGAGCCEYCQSTDPEYTGLVAFSKTADLNAAFCAAGGCPETCAAPEYPPSATAVCNASGHCEVAFQ